LSSLLEMAADGKKVDLLRLIHPKKMQRDCVHLCGGLRREHSVERLRRWFLRRIHHEPKICSGECPSTMPQPYHDCGRHWFECLHK